MYCNKMHAKSQRSATYAALACSFSVIDIEMLDAIREGKIFEVETDAGLLYGSLMEPVEVSRSRYLPTWVHFRFDDIAHAKDVIPSAEYDRLNVNSGKWNWILPHEDYAPTLKRMFDALVALNPRNFKIKG